MKRQVAELTDRLQQQQHATPTADDQMALLEKSYELAAKYMNDGGQNGQTAQVPVAGTVTQKPQAQPVQAIRETTVSGLQQPMSDADFIRACSQPRNYGFNTAVGTGYAIGRNTIAACIHQDQTLTDGQAVKLRLLEPMQAGNIVVPKNTLVAGTAKVQGERLDILVSSIEYVATSSRWNSPCSTRTGKRVFPCRPLWSRKRSTKLWQYRKRAGYKHFLCPKCRAAGGNGRDKGACCKERPATSPRSSEP